MKNRITTIRHEKLLKLHENIGVLMLGETNKEYRKELETLKANTVKELKKEQRKLGMIK